MTENDPDLSAKQQRALTGARSQDPPTPPPPKNAGRWTAAFLAALVAAIYILVTQCGADDNAAPSELDDGLLDCDEPSIVLLDMQWEPHPLESGPPLWDLMSASVRITNNTRHKIEVTGANLVAVRHDQYGIRQPTRKYDGYQIPDGDGSAHTRDWVNGFDSIEYSKDDTDKDVQLGRAGDSPPDVELSPSWKFENDDLEYGCLTQRIEQRTP